MGSTVIALNTRAERLSGGADGIAQIQSTSRTFGATSTHDLKGKLNFVGATPRPLDLTIRVTSCRSALHPFSAVQPPQRQSWERTSVQIIAINMIDGNRFVRFGAPCTNPLRGRVAWGDGVQYS